MTMKKINEENENYINNKYQDKTDDKVMFYLRRNFPFQIIDNDFMLSKHFIKVDDKLHYLNENKNYLKNKILSLIEDDFHSVNKPTIVRTIKKYLEIILLME
jgi:hypothetical protein